MMVRTISIDFDEISSGLPDVHHIIIQNRTIIQNHIIKIGFSFLLQKRSWDTWVLWGGLLLAKNMFFRALPL